MRNIEKVEIVVLILTALSLIVAVAVKLSDNKK